METNEEVIAEFRRNGGHVGGWLEGTPVVLIHHRPERVTPLAYQPLLGGLAIVGSNGGAAVEPAWCGNLRRRPSVRVEVSMRARELLGAARAEIWPALVAGAPVLATYQARSARRFPVFLLETEGRS